MANFEWFKSFVQLTATITSNYPMKWIEPKPEVIGTVPDEDLLSSERLERIYIVVLEAKENKKPPPMQRKRGASWYEAR